MTSSPAELRLAAVPGVPLVQPGDDLGALLVGALRGASMDVLDGDVFVVAQKIVSKAEGRYARLADARPSTRARALAEQTDKDPRLVQIILDESREVVRHRPGVLVVEHRLGFVMANAGVDRSNIEETEDGERVLLLPLDPDASCAALAAAFRTHFDAQVAVIINDSVGRAFRTGTASIALGAAGVPALDDLRGAPDLFGRPLEVSLVALADQLAAAGALLMGEGAEGRPLVRIRGMVQRSAHLPASALVREREQDLFR